MHVSPHTGTHPARTACFLPFLMTTQAERALRQYTRRVSLKGGMPSHGGSGSGPPLRQSGCFLPLQAAQLWTALCWVCTRGCVHIGTNHQADLWHRRYIHLNFCSILWNCPPKGVPIYILTFWFPTYRRCIINFWLFAKLIRANYIAILTLMSTSHIDDVDHHCILLFESPFLLTVNYLLASITWAGKKITYVHEGFFLLFCRCSTYFKKISLFVTNNTNIF